MAEKPVGETVGLKPLPGKALRGASTVWGGFIVCAWQEGNWPSTAIA